MCLAHTEADKVPTTRAEKIMLEEAGLWERTVVVPDLDMDPQAFKEILLSVSLPQTSR